MVKYELKPNCRHQESTPCIVYSISDSPPSWVKMQQTSRHTFFHFLNASSIIRHAFRELTCDSMLDKCAYGKAES